MQYKLKQREYSIELKGISELFGTSFIVPNYQRGYRWGKQEITELLDEMYKYAQSTCNKDNKISKFYYLQPVVVKSIGNDESCSVF